MEIFDTLQNEKNSLIQI